MFLNILNIEAQTGITDDRFASLVLSITEEASKWDYNFRPLLYVHVLRPLAWVGFLDELRDGSQRLFTKTPLWDSALRLETDVFRVPVTQH